MRALIIGASGLVGDYLFREGLRRGIICSGTFFKHADERFRPLDITDSVAARAVITEERPDIIIQSAAQPHVDYCEDHAEETRRVNVTGTSHVAAAAAERGIPLVYFSSDYVFDGAAGPYRETDEPRPLSEYARQKVQCERLLQAGGERHLIIRTTSVYGWEREKKNFVYGLAARLGRGETARVPRDQYGSPTYARDLAAAVWDLIARGARGVYNVSGPATMNRYDFSLAIASVFGLPAERIEPVATAELHQSAPRPLRAGLVIEKLIRETGSSMLQPQEALAHMKGDPHPFRTSLI